jgi:hypothetical protein
VRSPNHPTPLFFCHLPKTAGVSVISHLGALFGQERCWLDQSASAGNWIHSTDELQKYRLITGHVPLRILDHLGFHANSFTVLREPIERTISHYFFLRSRRDLPKRANGTLITIDEFVDHPSTRGVAYNFQTFQLAVEVDERGEYVNPLDAYNSERAVASLDRVDVVGTTEELDLTLALLHCKLGWMPPGKLDRLNQAEDATGRLRLKANTLRRIADANLLDIETYEYARRRLQTDVHEILARASTAESKRLVTSRSFNAAKRISGHFGHNHLVTTAH